jgi:hypothetical protein
MASTDSLVSVLASIRSAFGAEAFSAALASMNSETKTGIKTKAAKPVPAATAEDKPKRTVPPGVSAWVAKVNGVLEHMLENGWEPFEITKSSKKSGTKTTTQFAGSSSEKKEMNGRMVFVFSDSGKAPTYSQALSVAASRKDDAEEAPTSSASSVVSTESTAEKKRPGRPKGSKNKPKTEAAPSVPAPAPQAKPSAPASVSDGEDNSVVSESSSKKKAGRPKMTEEQKQAAKAARSAKMASMTPEELRQLKEAKAAKKAERAAKKSAAGDASAEDSD